MMPNSSHPQMAHFLQSQQNHHHLSHVSKVAAASRQQQQLQLICQQQSLVNEQHQLLLAAAAAAAAAGGASSTSASPVASSSAAAATRYKTELCRSYQENGTCKYAEKCQFAHGHAELRSLNRHPKYKTELCRTFHAQGYCPYGPRCHFVHDAEAAASKQQQQQRHQSTAGDRLNSPGQGGDRLIQVAAALAALNLNSKHSSGSIASSSSPQSYLELDNDVLSPHTDASSLLMYASASASLHSTSNDSVTSSRKQSTSSCSSAASSTSSLSPPSSRSLSPDLMPIGFASIHHQQQQQQQHHHHQRSSPSACDAIGYDSTALLVSQLLSSIGQLNLDNDQQLSVIQTLLSTALTTSSVGLF